MTLLLVTGLFLVTVLAWGGAKVACNYHPATYLNFKPAPLKRLLGSPKDAALAFQHAMETRSFEAAREAATGPALEQVEQMAAACDETCNAARPELERSLATRGTLLSRRGGRAEVLVESFNGETLVVGRRYAVAQTGGVWKTVRQLE